MQIVPIRAFGSGSIADSEKGGAAVKRALLVLLCVLLLTGVCFAEEADEVSS